MAAKQDKPHAACGAKTRSGTPCQTRPMPNGRCRMHGGTSTGPSPESAAGNQNGRKHGLFAKSLSHRGLEVYEAAREMAPHDKASDLVNFTLGQIAQAFEETDRLAEAKGLVGKYLQGLVASGQIGPDAANDLLRRLSVPTLDVLGKAISPIKGLLEVKKGQDGDESDPLKELEQIIRESAKRRE